MSPVHCVNHVSGPDPNKVGGADGIRTHDLLDAIEARSQLRHGPTEGVPKFITAGERESCVFPSGFSKFYHFIGRCRLCCCLFEETNDPAHPTPKGCQRNSGSSYCSIGTHVCGRLLVVSPAAYPSETSRSFRILHRPAHSGHSGKGRKDQLRNRPAKPRADRHLCPLRFSARRLRALLVRQAALRPAYSHVIATSLTLRGMLLRHLWQPPLRDGPLLPRQFFAGCFGGISAKPGAASFKLVSTSGFTSPIAQRIPPPSRLRKNSFVQFSGRSPIAV